MSTGAGAPRPQPPADLDAVQAWQHHVQDDEVGRVLDHRRERLQTVLGSVDREARVREVWDSTSRMVGSSSTTRIRLARVTNPR